MTLTPETEKKLCDICEKERGKRKKSADFAQYAGQGFENLPDYDKEKRDAQELLRLLKKYILSSSLIEQVMNEADFTYDHSPQKGGRPPHHTDHLIGQMGALLLDMPTRSEVARIIYEKFKSYDIMYKNDLRDADGIEQILVKKFPNNWKKK